MGERCRLCLNHMYTGRGVCAECRGLRDQDPKYLIANDAEWNAICDLNREGYKVLTTGWPDILAWRGDEMIMREVKRVGSHKNGIEKTRLNPAQVLMHKVLRSHGIDVGIVRVL